MISKNTKSRLFLIDEIRGIAIICMVFYHLAYSINIFHNNGSFSFNLPFMDAQWMNILRDVFVGIFVLISGMSCNLSKNNIKRGILTIILALLVSLVTYVFVPDNLILFGILHMLGFCMLIYGILQKLFNKCNNFFLVPIFIILFIATFHIRQGFIGINGFSFTLPRVLYQTPFLFPLGMPNSSFMSADYFPLMPWLFLFILGGLLGKNLHRVKKSSFAYKSHIPFLAFAGRNTIWIYLAHQPIIWGILYVISFLLSNIH